MVTPGIGEPPFSAHRGTVWVSDQIQTRVYRRRSLPGWEEPEAKKVRTIGTPSAPLSRIPLMTVDHHSLAVPCTWIGSPGCISPMARTAVVRIVRADRPASHRAPASPLNDCSPASSSRLPGRHGRRDKHAVYSRFSSSSGGSLTSISGCSVTSSAGTKAIRMPHPA